VCGVDHSRCMNARSNRILITALALSLGVHLVFAFVVRNVSRVEAATTQPTHVEIVRIVPPPTPTPTPAPSPKPLLAPQPAHAAVTPAHNARVSVAPPKFSDSGAASGPAEPVAVATGGDLPQGTPEPVAPSPTPKPACAVPNATAHTIDVMPADAPEDASSSPATADVRVTLDAAGHVTGTEIYRSTNDTRMDHAALVAARGSTYAPAIVECIPVGGSYIFRVEFQ
jgi:TonB family protein